MDEAEKMLDEYFWARWAYERAQGEPSRIQVVTLKDARAAVLAAMRKAVGVSEEFKAWLCSEMPPGTVISNPEWWAPRIARALQAAAPQPPALDRDGEERMAQSIYESWAFHGDDPQKPAWVPGGNSNRQTEARALAQAAIRAMKGGKNG